jgi:uncharacterized protein YdeI (YjbR/CyaY-like superfamily)
MEEKPKKTWDKSAFWTEELELLKAIINRTELVETTKWGGPAYTYNGKNVLGIGGFKSYFTISFFKGIFLKDEAGVLVNAQEGLTKSLRQWRFETKADINEKLVLQYINEAIEVEKAGMAMKPAKKPDAIIPELLQKTFNASPEMAANFKNFIPFKQREFIEYIEEAKREETKLSRLEKIKPLILEGRGLNDRYR